MKKPPRTSRETDMKKQPAEKPVSLAPLSFDDAIKALVKVKSEKIKPSAS